VQVKPVQRIAHDGPTCRMIWGTGSRRDVVVLSPGAVFAGYHIEALIGEGGMGAVYLARHPRLPRYDALKVLHPRLSTEPSYAVRFEREADAAARLSHPSVVAVYDRGMEGDQLWISMQYVRGTDAAAELRMHGPMSLRRAIAVVTAVADALDHAHAHGLVHRDVKPDNILLSPTDTGGERAMLTDFGIASAAGHTALTSTGSFVATMTYAPVEQLEGRGVDARTDVYALGAVLFELLTGERPFADLGLEALYAAKIRGDVPDLTQRRPDLPDAVAAVVRRAMAGDPQLRFASCGELAEALQLAAAPAPPPPPPMPLPPPPPLPPTMPQERPPSTGETRVEFPPPPVPPPPWPQQPPPRPARRRTGLLIGALLLVLVVAGGVVTLVLLTGGPDAPSGLRATTATGQVHLRWNAVPEADHYEIRRDGTRLGDTEETRYTDGSVEGGRRYHYQVTAVTGSGDRSSAATFAPITAAIGAPQLAPATVDGVTVTLSWDAVPGAEHYEISRGGTALDEVTETTYTDQQAPPGRQHYEVAAVDEDGQGGRASSSTTIDVTPWGGIQPVASAYPQLIPASPDDTLAGPVGAHTCAVGTPSGQSLELVACTFDNGITAYVNRFADAATLADVVQFYNYGQPIVTWTCGDATKGQYTEALYPGDNTPFELITFTDPDLALFNMFITWTPDHSIDDLYNTFFTSGILCS
jgi:serine/threonine protein kinase